MFFTNKHKALNLIPLLVVSMFSMISCNKEGDSSDQSINKEPQFLYAGYKYEGNTYNTVDKKAIVLINDSLLNLSPNKLSEGVAVFGNGTDVWVSGTENTNAEDKKIVYWKNDQIHYLSDANKYNQARAIYEDQGKIYVSGTELVNYQGARRPFQRLWINGELTVNQGALDFSAIEAITTYNGAYYLSGQFAQAACIWHNGTMRTIRNSPSNATYIRRTATDTIALGYGGLNADSDVLMVWKNGENVLAHPINNRVVNVLGTMSGNDYYFVTMPSTANNTPPKVYKNNILLYTLPPSNTMRVAAIQVYRNKVYVLGNIIENNKSIPTLWVDGIPQTLRQASENIFLKHMYIAEK